MKHLLTTLLAILAALTFANAQPAVAAPEEPKYALLVGINDYSRDGLTKLDGCLNDVRDMRQALIDDFGFKSENILVLTNKDATRAGIVKAFRAQLGANAAKAPNGNFLFYYSGHGFQAPDLNGDEKLEDPNDTKDETFMAWDVDLVDDDVDILCRETRGVKNFTGALTVILDSCHSGTATRGGPQEGKPNVKSAPANYEAPPEAPLSETKIKGNPNAGSLVAFSGSLSTQSSEEKLFPVAPKAGEKGATKNEYHGVLTYYLLQAMKTATKSTSNSQIWTQIATVLSGKYNQLPLLEGGRTNQPFLGGANRSTVPPIPYTLAGDTLTFSRGVEAGAVKGGFIKVSSAGQPAKQLSISSAELGKATATLPKDAKVGANGTVELLTPYFGSEPLKVGLGANIAADNPVAARLKAHYTQDSSSFVSLAAGEAPNVYLLRATRGEALPNFKENETEKLGDAGYMVSKAPGGQAIFGVWMPANAAALAKIAATDAAAVFADRTSAAEATANAVEKAIALAVTAKANADIANTKAKEIAAAPAADATKVIEANLAADAAKAAVVKADAFVVDSQRVAGVARAEAQAAETAAKTASEIAKSVMPDDIMAAQEIRLFETLDNYAAQSNVKTLSNKIESGLTAKEAVKITTYLVKGTTNASGKWSADPANRNGTEIDPSKRKFNAGERLRIEFKNLTSQPVYVSFVWLSGDGSITVMQDTKDRRQIVLASKDEAEDTATTGYYAITGPATEETIKFFISRQPIDVNYLDRDAIRRDGISGGLSAFNLIAGQMMGTRGAPSLESDQPEFESWDTLSMPIIIVDADGGGKGFLDVSK